MSCASAVKHLSASSSWLVALVRAIDILAAKKQSVSKRSCRLSMGGHARRKVESHARLSVALGDQILPCRRQSSCFISASLPHCG